MPPLPVGVAMQVIGVIAAVATAVGLRHRVAMPLALACGLFLNGMATSLGVVVHNDSEDVVRIAQVTVDDAFVGFSAKRLALAPRGRTQLEIDYSWIRGEPYEIGVLTSTGAIVQTQVGGAQDS